MVEIKKLSILIILVVNSLLFIGCKSSSDAKEGFSLFLTDIENPNYMHKVSFSENAKSIKYDTIIFKNNNSCNKDQYLDEDIIGGKILNSCGIYNIEKNKYVGFSNSIPLERKKNLIFLYDTEKLKITTFDVNNETFNIDEKLKSFEFQFFNNKPVFSNISSDFKNILTLKLTGSVSHKLNASFDIYLKDLESNTEDMIVKDVNGVKISESSNAESVPSIIWINKNEFIYTDYIHNINSSDCQFKKYNTLNDNNTLVGEIKDVKQSRVNFKFIKNDIGEIYFIIENEIFKIDFLKNKISSSAEFNIGNGFSLFKDGECYNLKYKGKNIGGNIPFNSTFEFNKKFYRTINESIVLMYKNEVGDVNPEWKNICKVWSLANREWINIPIKNSSKITGFIANTPAAQGPSTLSN